LCRRCELPQQRSNEPRLYEYAERDTQRVASRQLFGQHSGASGIEREIPTPSARSQRATGKSSGSFPPRRSRRDLARDDAADLGAEAART
jgi:hypothetical protein